MQHIPHIERSRAFTNNTLDSLRAELAAELERSPERDKLTIVATGSYGRKEASSESDIDYFILFDADDTADDRIETELAGIQRVIEARVPNRTGDTETFGSHTVVSFQKMKTNIGGKNDDNQSLTRRMLLLLEGAWLYQEGRFKKYQRSLLKRYLENSSPKAKLPRFLLNDIIRYYRTITTDFEYKVAEDGKKWGLRNIKLRFSRKLLYFGGVLVVAEMADVGYERWESRALELLSMPVLQRINNLISDDCSDNVLSIYDEFIRNVTNPKIRKELQAVEKDDRLSSNTYQRLRQLSEDFSVALGKCLTRRYATDHPIHHGLMF